MATRSKARNAGSGSPPSGEPEYLVVGSLRRAYGVRGEIVMEVRTDFPERLKAGSRVFLGDSHVPMMLQSVRPHSEGLLLHFEGVHTPEEAARHRNQLVFVTTVDRPALPAGYFYDYQLVGFAIVEAETGSTLGTLREILRTGANEVYVVGRPDGSEILLPVIASVVLQVDAGGRTIRVHLLPGLIDEDGAR